MKKDGEPLIREKLGQYVRLLKEEFSQGLILPTKTSANTDGTKKVSSSINTNTVTTSKSFSNTQSSTNQDNKSTFETRELNIEDTFKCSRPELFQTFTDINMVRAFTQNSVSQYDCQQSGQFSLFGDNITGHFLDIIPYERIDMLWRFKSWPKEHFSHVSLQFQEDTDQTKLIIHQTGVPTQFYDNTMVSFIDGFYLFIFSCILGRMETFLFGKYQINIWLWSSTVIKTIIYS